MNTCEIDGEDLSSATKNRLLTVTEARGLTLARLQVCDILEAQFVGFANEAGIKFLGIFN